MKTTPKDQAVVLTEDLPPPIPSELTVDWMQELSEQELKEIRLRVEARLRLASNKP